MDGHYVRVVTRWLSRVVAVATLASCSTASSSGQTVCPSSHRVTLLTTVLRVGIPGPAFATSPGAPTWIVTHDRPDPEGLFAGVGGIATVSAVAAGSLAVRTSISPSDLAGKPTITLHTGRWVRLPVGAGDWQLVTPTLGTTALSVVVASCPP